MIKKITIEELEGDYAISKKVVTFFVLPIYKTVDKTTNVDIVRQFKNKRIKVKGFKNED